MMGWMAPLVLEVNLTGHKFAADDPEGKAQIAAFVQGLQHQLSPARAPCKV